MPPVQPPATAPCITTARTSPFALLEIAFLGISVALICSYRSETGDESILTQEFQPKQFCWDLAHGLVTGLAVFFATLSCCAALHREFAYINGCIKAWMCNRGIRKWNANIRAYQLPNVTQSINLRLLISLGMKTALVLLIFNVVVPFFILKASRHAAVQSMTAGLQDGWIHATHRIEVDNWVALPRWQLADLDVISLVKGWLAHSTSGLLHSFFPPDLAEHTEEVVAQTWQAICVITMLLVRVFVPPLILFIKVTWKVLCLAHLQGTILFPWMPYTYWFGRLLVNYCWERVLFGWVLVNGLPQSVLYPWVLLSAVALLVMAPVFASEAQILKQNTGGVTLPLLLSTLTANHVTSLLVFDIVRVLASVPFRGGPEAFEALAVVSRMNEARGAADYFRAFQIMTAVGIALVVLAASNLNNGPIVERVETRVLSAGGAHTPTAPRIKSSRSRKSKRTPSENCLPTPGSQLLLKSALDRSVHMPCVKEAEEEPNPDSENVPYRRVEAECVSPGGGVDLGGGQSSNIDESSVQVGAEDGSYSDRDSSSSSSGSSSLEYSARDPSPQPSPQQCSARTQVASGQGQLGQEQCYRSRHRQSLPPMLESRRLESSGRPHTSTESSTSSEPSALLKPNKPWPARSNIPSRPKDGSGPRVSVNCGSRA
eukprot:Gregarina_sp_Pseudo_9__2414@NODE_270_length_3340_cov_36_270524_g253_i0_p1_GENE_NODE_270_length_3340_cov_36_270524_g253_i0NODE_270_length_3340_cov_36_270524_g253_i0_p1_ORF_typecomplete_len658_score108_17_NODE_270_length_3340_cov_36_270524_g253_i01182091